LRVLYFIKKQLGVGSVHIENKKTMADFRIRKRKTISSIILPIFDKYPLLTSKYFNYHKFKQSYEILENPNYSTTEKDLFLSNLNKIEKPDNYISPV
jgi:hypothetical protein